MFGLLEEHVEKPLADFSLPGFVHKNPSVGPKSFYSSKTRYMLAARFSGQLGPKLDVEAHPEIQRKKKKTMTKCRVYAKRPWVFPSLSLCHR